MKILIVDTYYPDFLKNVRRKYPNLKKEPYQKQLNLLLSQGFGTADFYSHNLKKLGHEAFDVIANDEILQKRWAQENSQDIKFGGIYSKLQFLPYFHLFRRFLPKPTWIAETVLAQIRKAKPDVVYMQNMSLLDQQTLRDVKRYCKLLIGQIASPLPEKDKLGEYQLVLTSFPHFVAKLRGMGISSEYFKIGFEPRVLKKVGKQERIYDVAFIGGFTPHHLKGTRILEEIAKKIPIHVWGRGSEYLSLLSPLRRKFHGEAWALDMYKILAQSKIVLNRHIDVADGYANNMRLYETTGMGAMLLTDRKRNLNDLFKVGREIIDYANAKDAIGKIMYYLAHDNEREKIANAGQKHTLLKHTYKKRMEELILIIQKYV